MKDYILLIEDDAWLADVEVSVLQKAGYEVKIAGHAMAAMALIDTHPPICIVADMFLSGATVMGLLNELQSHPDTTDIPVVLCTNVADSLGDGELSAYGVRRVVDKLTMQPDDLVAAVRSVT